MMIILKTVVSTLDVLMALILFAFGRESTNGASVIGFGSMILLLLANLIFMWQ